MQAVDGVAGGGRRGRRRAGALAADGRADERLLGRRESQRAGSASAPAARRASATAPSATRSAQAAIAKRVVAVARRDLLEGRVPRPAVLGTRLHEDLVGLQRAVR